MGQVSPPASMYPRQESNLYLEFRKPSFYPLNYGDVDLSRIPAPFILNTRLSCTGSCTWLGRFEDVRR